MAGKRFLKKVASRLCRYPTGQKFCRNHSISLHFRDKHVLCFMQKFKMATKSGGKTIFGKNRQYTLQIPCGSKISSKSLRFRDKHVFAFNAEIQDGRQKWRENNFCKKLPVDSGDTLWVKIFVEIALSRSVSEINAFLRFQR